MSNNYSFIEWLIGAIISQNYNRETQLWFVTPGYDSRKFYKLVHLLQSCGFTVKVDGICIGVFWNEYKYEFLTMLALLTPAKFEF